MSYPPSVGIEHYVGTYGKAVFRYPIPVVQKSYDTWLEILRKIPSTPEPQPRQPLDKEWEYWVTQVWAAEVSGLFSSIFQIC